MTRKHKRESSQYVEPQASTPKDNSWEFDDIVFGTDDR
jgi:hypothetical protein